MMEPTRWTVDGLPVFTDLERQGMRDFHAAYEDAYDAIAVDVRQVLERMPKMKALIDQVPPAQLEAQSKAGRLMMQQAIVDDVWGPVIATQRAQGAMYAAMAVPFRDWFDLVGAFQHAILPVLLRAYADDAARLQRSVIAMNRYLDIAMSEVADAYLAAKEKQIQQQQLAIHELSTPVLQISERMLLLPIIGVLDTHRARSLTDHLLAAIRRHRALVVVMDLTGVAAVDSRVANHLLQSVEAARLMGAQVIVSGLSADVATALVTLGVQLETLLTVADLQRGIEAGAQIVARRAQPADPASSSSSSSPSAAPGTTA